MSKTKEDNFNLLKGLTEVKVLKQELKHKYLHIQIQSLIVIYVIIQNQNLQFIFFSSSIFYKGMYNNLKNEERSITDFLFKIDAHAKFYEAYKQSLNQEELKTQLLSTKKLVNEWKEWNDRIIEKQQ